MSASTASHGSSILRSPTSITSITSAIASFVASITISVTIASTPASGSAITIVTATPLTSGVSASAASHGSAILRSPTSITSSSSHDHAWVRLLDNGLDVRFVAFKVNGAFFDQLLGGFFFFKGDETKVFSLIFDLVKRLFNVANGSKLTKVSFDLVIGDFGL